MFKFLFSVFIICQGVIFCAAPCEVFFSPQDHLAERLIGLIDQEQKSIRVAVYSISHTKIARALERAKERGVAVELIVDPVSIKTRSPLHRLSKGQVPLFVWDGPVTFAASGKSRKGLMHDKFCIFGDHLVWTGSFNFTYDAELRNEENAVLLDSSSIAKKFLERFEEMKLRSCKSYLEYLALHPKKKSRKNSALAYTANKELEKLP